MTPLWDVGSKILSLIAKQNTYPSSSSTCPVAESQSLTIYLRMTLSKVPHNKVISSWLFVNSTQVYVDPGMLYSNFGQGTVVTSLKPSGTCIHMTKIQKQKASSQTSVLQSSATLQFCLNLRSMRL